MKTSEGDRAPEQTRWSGFAFVLLAVAVFGLIGVACGTAAPPVQVVKETVIVRETVPVYQTWIVRQEVTVRETVIVKETVIARPTVTPMDFTAFLPPGRGRELLLNNCTNCHSFVCAVIGQRDAGHWQKVKTNERSRVVGMSRQDYDTLFDYLTANFNDQKPEPELPPGLREIGCRTPPS